jgi:hypothetical protein
VTTVLSSRAIIDRAVNGAPTIFAVLRASVALAHLRFSVVEEELIAMGFRELPQRSPKERSCMASVF